MPKNRPKVISVPVTREAVQQKIHLVRGKKVMLDADLAALYGVPTKALNQAVKRNALRFPAEFMFRLRKQEMEEVVTNCDHLRHLRFSPQLPYAFTQEGVAMLSSILHSPRAIQANILIMKTFARLRELIATNDLIRQKIEKLERKYKKHDKQFQIVFDAIREFLRVPEKPKRQIGFHVD